MNRRRPNPQRVAELLLWMITGACVVIAWTVVVIEGQFDQINAGQAVFVTLAGLSAPALCTAILQRHPTEWTGPLLGISVVATMLAVCRTNALGALAQVAGLVALCTVLLPAVVAVNHPALLGPRPAIRLVNWSWWISAALGMLIAVIGLTSGSVPTQWWYTRSPGPADGTATTLLICDCLVVSLGATSAVVLAVHRYRAMPAGGRPSLRPMVLPLIGWAVAASISMVWTAVWGISDPTATMAVEPAAAVLLLLPPLMVGILAAGIGWIDLMVRRPSTLSANSGPADSRPRRDAETFVQQYLSRALADPSIRVLYPDQSAPNTWVENWLDSRGRIVQQDIAGLDRAVTLIRRGSTLIGLIEHDAAVAARPDAVELVATGAGLIMETERLMAAARRDLESSRELAARLLSAADQPRELLRAELLAGPLGELACTGTDLAQGTPMAEVAPRLNGIAAQVRAMSHGVFPPSLTNGGLQAALPGALTPNHRYPLVIEMTAYLAARSDDSAEISDAVLDGEPAVLIRSGLPPTDAVRDRVTALGGRVEAAEDRWAITVPSGT